MMAHTHNGAGANHTGEGGTNNNEEGRQRIEQSIEDIVENLRQFTITIEEYSSESQNRIFEKMYVFSHLLPSSTPSQSTSQLSHAPYLLLNKKYGDKRI